MYRSSVRIIRPDILSSIYNQQSIARIGLAVCLLFFSVFVVTPVAAQPASPAPNSASPSSKATTTTKGLDEQVQDIKSDVLAIAAELGNLEERLLYPSNTQIAVFISFDENQSVPLGSARISIDGELVTHHIYSFQEIEALKKGGVQRVYTGNVKTGEHQIEVAIASQRGTGKDSETIKRFTFTKKVDPKLVGIKLSREALGGANIEIKDW